MDETRSLKLTVLFCSSFIFLSSLLFSHQSLADTSGEQICYSTDSSGDNSCGDGAMCVTRILNEGKKKFPASCKENYECESGTCEQNICMKVGTCKGCGTNGNPPNATTGLCCDGLTNSEGKCVFTNTCSDFYNTCEAGYVCQSVSNTKSQGQIEMEQGAALQDLSCAPEMVACLSNADCCSNICIEIPSTIPGVASTSKTCAPYKECVRCVEDGRQKSDNLECCPGLVEQAGFCVQFITPPLAEPSFPYTINKQCGIEWQNPDDVMGVYESEYWMAAFEFFFMSQYDTMKDSVRDEYNAYPNSFMGFNHNNFEIAKTLFSMRNPIDNVYHERIQKFADIVKFIGTQSIKYNSQYQYFQDMSRLFTVNSDRALELGKAYEYILPMFGNSLTEIEKHYWGSYQSSAAGTNPRTNEPGGYDSVREAEYNICAKTMIHQPDSLCIKSCLAFTDPQTPEGTDFLFTSASTSTSSADADTTLSSTSSSSSSEIYRLVDPLVPTFGGSTGYVNASSTCTSYVCEDSTYATTIQNHNNDSSLDACPSNLVGKVLNTEDIPTDILSDISSDSVKNNDTWRKIKITRGIFRHLVPKDASSDSYVFDTTGDECNPNSVTKTQKVCRWTGQNTSCYVYAPAVLKSDDSILKNSLALLIGSWTDKQYTGWEAELILITLLVAAAIALSILIGYEAWPFIAGPWWIIILTIAVISVGEVSTFAFIALPIKHMALRYYNYKQLSSTEGLIFKKEIGTLFERYAKLHFIKFGKVPDPTGQFAINDGMVLAKNIAFSSYLEAFNQGNNEKGSYMFYGNECHWDNEGQGQLDYLKKTMIFSELLRNFYTSSYYAWKDAADCMLRKPSEIITSDGTNLSGSGAPLPGSTLQNLVENNPSTYTNVGPSGLILSEANSTRNFGGSNSGANAGSASSDSDSANALINSYLSPIVNMQNPGQLLNIQSKTGKTAQGAASSGLSTSSSSSMASQNARLSALKNSPLDKRREEFKAIYGNNKPLMASINKQYEDFHKGSTKRLAALAKSDNSKLPSAPADRLSSSDMSGANSSEAKKDAKTKSDIEKMASSLIGKASSKMSPKMKASMPSFNSIKKSMDIYKSNKANYGSSKDFNVLLDSKDQKNSLRMDIAPDKDNSSIFELLNYSYRKNMKKLR